MTIDTWDRETQQAWTSLETRLTAYLETQPTVTVVIEMPSPLDDVKGASPYVQVITDDDGDARAEAASNHYLDVRYALTPERAAQLEALGFTAPTHAPAEASDAGSANYWLDLTLPEDAERMAGLLVTTLRDVYRVLHPSFLIASGFGPAGHLDSDELPLGLRVLEAEESAAAVGAAVAAPGGPDVLRDLVEATLRTVVDQDLEYDDDGDLPIDADETTIYVRVEEDSPSIRIFGPLVHGIRWTPRVGSALARANRRFRYGKVVFHGGVVMATTQLYAMPFVSSHLTHSLKGMQLMVSELVPELREELQGDVFSPGARGSSSEWENE